MKHSYLVNDVYKRFLVPKASDKHYVCIARIATVVTAGLGSAISFLAEDIQQLLTIAFVVMSGAMPIGLLRWFWWRLNAKGDMVALICAYILAPLLLFGKVFDGPARIILGLGPGICFSSDPNLLGARMLFMLISVTTIAITVSLLTKPTDEKRLKEFVMRARPFHFFWKPVIERTASEYHEYESFGRTIVSWVLALLCVWSLVFGLGKLFLGSHIVSTVCLLVFVISLCLSVRRINEDFAEVTNHGAKPENRCIEASAMSRKV